MSKSTEERGKSQKQRPRQDFEKKKTQKRKSVRGQCETDYGECKQIKTFSLTPTACENLSRISEGLNISRSELIEQLSRLLGGLIENPKEHESAATDFDFSHKLDKGSR